MRRTSAGVATRRRVVMVIAVKRDATAVWQIARRILKWKKAKNWMFVQVKFNAKNDKNYRKQTCIRNPAEDMSSCSLARSSADIDSFYKQKLLLKKHWLLKYNSQ
jgi:hypothetical protein